MWCFTRLGFLCISFCLISGSVDSVFFVVKKKMDESLSKEDICRKEKDGRVVRKLEERLGDIFAGTSQFLAITRSKKPLQEFLDTVNKMISILLMLLCMNPCSIQHCFDYQEKSILKPGRLVSDAYVEYKILGVIEKVIELVELNRLKHAIVGLSGVIGLSREQRKVLIIVVVLVANPSIILMDEPICGLHARPAAVVMRAVRNIVDTGITVVCTIHQPSIDIFESYDECTLYQVTGSEMSWLLLTLALPVKYDGVSVLYIKVPPLLQPTLYSFTGIECEGLSILLHHKRY
ncbi:hypothetical protein Fmac_011758 [Flemingia macrophylla]|uniref:ABC transporter domain-containing protein n=1 Tax=Flemingia macrophylla TaxID=520843 RepID=A0ABD1MNE0_9FABA